MDEPVKTAFVVRFAGASHPRTAEQHLLEESPLSVRIAGRSDISLMRTPGNDRELVVGFLLTEGFIRGMADIAVLEHCQEELGKGVGDPDAAVPDTFAGSGDAIRVVLAGEAGTDVAERGMLVGSSCSLCGRERIEAILDDLAPMKDDARFTLQSLFQAPGRMRSAQPLFESTGASHAAALFDAQGRIDVVREDIGRHNALDKVIGHALLTGRATAGCGVMLSGRVSFEMVAKAARAGLPLVAAVSAPSALGVAAAEKLNVTLCGFVRGEGFTCYSHPERLVR